MPDFTSSASVINWLLTPVPLLDGMESFLPIYVALPVIVAYPLIAIVYLYVIIRFVFPPFYLCLKLCHTLYVAKNKVDKKTGKLPQETSLAVWGAIETTLITALQFGFIAALLCILSLPVLLYQFNNQEVYYIIVPIAYCLLLGVWLLSEDSGPWYRRTVHPYVVALFVSQTILIITYSSYFALGAYVGLYSLVAGGLFSLMYALVSLAAFFLLLPYTKIIEYPKTRNDIFDDLVAVYEKYYMGGDVDEWSAEVDKITDPMPAFSGVIELREKADTTAKIRVRKHVRKLERQGKEVPEEISTDLFDV